MVYFWFYDYSDMRGVICTAHGKVPEVKLCLFWRNCAIYIYYCKECVEVNILKAGFNFKAVSVTYFLRVRLKWITFKDSVRTAQ
jgi:hypothetical protein